MRVSCDIMRRVALIWRDHAFETLRRSGYRSSGARTAIVSALAEQECCRSAQEIHGGLHASGGGVGVASVYRALELLTTLGLVQRVDVGSGTSRFEPVLPEGDHHHHVVCDDCGRVDPFVNPGLEQAIEEAAGGIGYDVAGHEVILHGVCSDCRT
jgi:Fur family ferric uptake transcriptional regulator